MSMFNAPAILAASYGTTVAEYADDMVAILGDNGFLHICNKDEDGLFVLTTLTNWKGSALEAANRQMVSEPL